MICRAWRAIGYELPRAATFTSSESHISAAELLFDPDQCLPANGFLQSSRSFDDGVCEMSTPVTLQIFGGFLLFAVVFATLERYFPFRQQLAFRRGWFTDVVYFAVGCVVGHLSDAASLWGVLLIRHVTGVDAQGMAATQPAWLQFLEILLIADFCAYWYHRGIHTSARLWRLHQIHHTSKRMDWLANARLHPLDKVLGDCAQFIPIFCLGFGKAPLFVYTIFLGFQGFLNHSNVKVSFGPLRWIIASPAFHHWHHGDDPRAYNKNFAPHLVIFDRLFGTFYLPTDRRMPGTYGLSEAVPEGFWGQLLHPFRKWAAMPAQIRDDAERVTSGSD
jgi:sterol desaturase/sphingolipid hydroxylase (fatty acid hydroxylase superfamily)